MTLIKASFLVACLVLAAFVPISVAHDVWATPSAVCGSETRWTVQNDFSNTVTLTLKIPTSLGPAGTQVVLGRRGSSTDSQSEIITSGKTISGSAVWKDGYKIPNWSKTSTLSNAGPCTTKPAPTTTKAVTTKPPTTKPATTTPPPTTTTKVVTTPPPTTTTVPPTTTVEITTTVAPTTTVPPTTTVAPTTTVPPTTTQLKTFAIPTTTPPPPTTTVVTSPPTTIQTAPPPTKPNIAPQCVCDSASFAGTRPQNISEQCLSFQCVQNQCQVSIISSCCGNGVLDQGEQCDFSIQNQSTCCNATCFGCLAAAKHKGKALVIGLAVGGTAAVVFIAVIAVLFLKVTAMGTRDFATSVKTAFGTASNNPVYESLASNTNPTYTEML